MFRLAKYSLFIQAIIWFSLIWLVGHWTSLHWYGSTGYTHWCDRENNLVKAASSYKYSVDNYFLGVDLVITSRWTSWVCLNRVEEWNVSEETECALAVRREFGRLALKPSLQQCILSSSLLAAFSMYKAWHIVPGTGHQIMACHVHICV